MVSRHSKFRRRPNLLAGVGLALLIAPGGCSSGWMSWSDRDADRQRALQDQRLEPGQKRVKVGGDGLSLGDAQESALSPQELADEVAQLLAAQRYTSAKHLVYRYPDVALELLRSATSRQAADKELLAIAQLHDQQCLSGDPAAGWLALLQGRAKNSQPFSAYETARREFLQHLRNGYVEEALAIKLTSALDGASRAMLTIDAWELTGAALLIADRPNEAGEALRRGAELSPGAPYQQAHLMLLLSEAQRRAGDADAAASSWRNAVLQASELLVQEIPIVDPVLWERAAYLRPYDVPWPRAAVKRLGQAHGGDFGPVLAAQAGRDRALGPAASGDTAMDDMLLWTCIGQWRLERDEAQAALVAFKQAESQTTDSRIRERLQLAQAKALLRLNQEAAATVILVRLAGEAQAAHSQAARATLGALKLQAGNTQQGFKLLQGACEEHPTADWPHRNEAEADLGLAYLMLGDETQGLRWLHAAQKRFELAGEQEQLLKCLWNEARYLEHAGKKREAKEVHQRLKSMENAASLPAAL